MSEIITPEPREPAEKKTIEYPYMPDGAHFEFVPETNKFMAAAKAYAAKHSLDKHYPNASVLVLNGEIIGMGANGSNYHDENGCRRKELRCKTGEGYELCEGCHPKNHSEPTAIRATTEAGKAMAGADLYLHGHWWCCEPCWNEMKKAGIKQVYLLEDAHEKFTK